MKEDIYAMLENLTSDAAELLPKIVLALLVIILGFIFAKLIERLVSRLILYLDSRVNQAVQIRMVNVDLKNSSRFISRTFFWVIIIISILISIQILGLNETNGAWLGRIVAFLPNILIAIIIVFVGIIAGRLFGDLIKMAALRTGLANGNYLGRIVRYLVLFLSIIIALDQLRVDIDFLKDMLIVVLAGLLFGASLAFGLGAQTSVGNILRTYYIRKTYQIGTRIRLGEVEGVITEIADHAVSIETKEGLVIVPTKKFSEQNVIIIEDQNG